MHVYLQSCLMSLPLCVYMCSDGFRKVMHIDTGLVKQERDGPVEFQHPYFKHGQDDLLENIKRKVELSIFFFQGCNQLTFYCYLPFYYENRSSTRSLFDVT